MVPGRNPTRLGDAVEPEDGVLVNRHSVAEERWNSKCWHVLQHVCRHRLLTLLLGVLLGFFLFFLIVFQLLLIFRPLWLPVRFLLLVLRSAPRSLPLRNVAKFASWCRHRPGGGLTPPEEGNLALDHDHQGGGRRALRKEQLTTGGPPDLGAAAQQPLRRWRQQLKQLPRSRTSTPRAAAAAVATGAEGLGVRGAGADGGVVGEQPMHRRDHELPGPPGRGRGHGLSPLGRGRGVGQRGLHGELVETRPESRRACRCCYQLPIRRALLTAAAAAKIGCRGYEGKG
mmetsp:Transcript_13529/g.47748  ORF Transcript_13529/g.47748 Transcript_13529/m.47748 type:complete len:285 (+) Transcript_13529:4116-4970(+)